MGLLLKTGINNDLVISALIAFLTILFLIISINLVPVLKNKLPNYSLQLGGLIGNTSFLGIPLAIALLPTSTINFTIGFDLGTTLFAWIFGPYLLHKKSIKNSSLNFTRFLSSIFISPASRGIIGVLVVYLLGLEDIMGEILWIPARIVIVFAIIIVGTRIGIITKDKTSFFDLKDGLKYTVLLKILFLPLIIYLICCVINFNKIETIALVLQAATPSAISTILMAEAYKVNQDLAAKILFTTTTISMISLSLLTIIL